MIRLILFTCCLAVIHCHAQSFGISLPKGPYTVGFKSYWKYDQSRFYNPSVLDSTIAPSPSAPRPVLLNVWFPAEKTGNSQQISYGDYQRPVNDKNLTPGLLAAYTKYNRRVLTDLAFLKEEKKMSPQERTLLQSVLDTKTSAWRSAKPVRQRFPLILYHQGYGASLEDNILLCETLASHGYIVVNSSYFNEKAWSLGIDGRMGSVRDISFILSNISTWEPYADIDRSAIVGHSGGGQVGHIAMAQSSLVLKAMVSLETTQEYHTYVNPLWNTFITPTLAGIDEIKTDLLFLTNREAFFQLADSMKNASRYYYSIPDVSHNDFISQGVIRRYIQELMDTTGKKKKEFERISKNYTSIGTVILSFLDAKLKNDTVAFTRYQQVQQSCTDSRQPCMEHIPPGITSPVPYSDTNESPTTRQFFRLLKSSVDNAAQLLQRHYLVDSFAVIFKPVYAYAMVEDLFETGKTRESSLLYKTYVQLLGQSFVDFYKKRCTMYNTFNGKPKDTFEKKIRILLAE